MGISLSTCRGESTFGSALPNLFRSLSPINRKLKLNHGQQNANERDPGEKADHQKKHRDLG